MTTDPNASLPSVEEIAALAAQGPHLVTSWGLHGVFHRRCCCGRGTPPTGALTSATAESFVAACRAAQDWRDDEGRKDRATVVRGAAQDAQGARTDLAAGEGTDQNGSDDDSPGARLPTSVATTTGSES